MREKLLIIDSSDRKTGDANDFNVSLGNSKSIQNVRMITLKSVHIPNTGYNIRSPYNVLDFSIDVSGMPVTQITIAEGQYSVATLLTVIAADAGAVSVGLTGSLNATTGLITFTSTSNITILASTTLPIGVVANTTFGLNHPLTGFPDLSGDKLFYLVSNSISNNANTLSTRADIHDCFSVVPVDVEWGQIVHYTSDHAELDSVDNAKNIRGRNIQAIDLRLYNDRLELVDLKGLNWQVIFKIYYD